MAMMTAQVAATSSVSSREDGSTIGDQGTFEGSNSGTFEGSNSLTSSIQMREDTSTLDMSGTNSLTSSIQRRGDNSSFSSYVMNGLSLPSSFASDDDRGGRTRESREMVESLSEQSSQQSQQQHGNNNDGAMEVYSRKSSREDTTITSLEDDDDDDANSEDQLALRISKETKPMMHLLRLLKEMDEGNSAEQDPKDRARASLISDFEKEVTLIEHRITDENLIMNGEQPPLPPNWIALEDPDSGDIYYANEATGETQWERPGLIRELKDKLDDMKNSQSSNNYEGGMQNNSNLSNNYEGSAQNNSNLSNNYEGGMKNNSNLSNNYEGSVQSHSNLSNNDDGSLADSNLSNRYEGEMINSNMSNNYEGGMRNSNMSNNYDGGMGNSNVSNNFEGSQRGGSVGINTYKQSSPISSNTSNNFDDSQKSNTMSSTYESSLTDSNTGEGLLPNWIALEDPDSGESYYANEATGESTWDKPIMPQSMPEEKSVDNTVDDDLPPDWIALEDADSGDTYYLNQVTMATTWDKPSKGNDNETIDSVETDQSSEQPSENDTVDDTVDDTVSDDDLPPGWEAILDPSSGDHYYAHESGETMWERPEFSVSDDVAATDNIANQGPPDDDDDDDSPVDENLPPGWFAAVDEDSGDQYYCNEVTGETTWDLPAEPAMENDSVNSPNQAPVGDEDDDLPEGWFAVTDPGSGDPYFVHEESGETTWDRPTPGAGTNEHLMSRLSINSNTVYEDDSIQF